MFIVVFEAWIAHVFIEVRAVWRLCIASRSQKINANESSTKSYVDPWVRMCCLLMALSPFSMAAPPVIKIEIKHHLFFPSSITIPPNTKVKLIVYNRDDTPEEFESYELNREKVIVGRSKAAIFVGPLAVGRYPFFGEFNPKTAQGEIIVQEGASVPK